MSNFDSLGLSSARFLAVLYSRPQPTVYLHSLHSLSIGEEDRAANSKAQVDNRGKDGQAEVVADPDV